MSRWPPTEVSEGYNYESVQENYVITDNRRILRVYYVQPLRHVEGMLMAYLPAERWAVLPALLVAPHPPAATRPAPGGAVAPPVPRGRRPRVTRPPLCAAPPPLGPPPNHPPNP